MALPFLILGAVMDIANLCWLSSPPLLVMSIFGNSLIYMVTDTLINSNSFNKFLNNN